MNGLILGRSTAQWLSLYTTTIAFIILILPSLLPHTDLTGANTALTGSVVVVGAYLAILANQQLTPVSDPRLVIGATVNAGHPTDEAIVVRKVAP